MTTNTSDSATVAHDFIEAVGGRNVKCARIDMTYDEGPDENGEPIYETVSYYLRVGYSHSDYESFLEKIYRYDGIDGWHEGMIWTKEYTWLERVVRGCSGHWVERGIPEIPEECQGPPTVKGASKT